MATALPLGVNLEDNRGPEIIRVASVFAVLATLALISRLATRTLKETSLGASNYAVVVGWLTAWGINIILYIGKCTPLQTLRNSCSLSHVDTYLSPAVHLGLGRHIEVVPRTDIVELKKVGDLS